MTSKQINVARKHRKNQERLKRNRRAEMENAKTSKKKGCMKNEKLIKQLEELCKGIKSSNRKTQNEAAKKWIDSQKKS